jgi:hypothetical protein
VRFECRKTALLNFLSVGGGARTLEQILGLAQFLEAEVELSGIDRTGGGLERLADARSEVL